MPKPVIEKPSTWHESLTEERIIEAAQSEMFGTANPGFCIACGADHHECEPDAREYECPECEDNTVYGAAELALYFR